MLYAMHGSERFFRSQPALKTEVLIQSTTFTIAWQKKVTLTVANRIPTQYQKRVICSNWEYFRTAMLSSLELISSGEFNKVDILSLSSAFKSDMFLVC